MKLTARENFADYEGGSGALQRFGEVSLCAHVGCQKAEILPQRARGVVFISAQGYSSGDGALSDKDTARSSSSLTRVPQTRNSRAESATVPGGCQPVRPRGLLNNSVILMILDRRLQSGASATVGVDVLRWHSRAFVSAVGAGRSWHLFRTREPGRAYVLADKADTTHRTFFAVLG